MPIFQINQLPTIPQDPADADVLAIEVNGVTYKVSKQALAAAIATNITPSITPASIGALALSGGQMTGNIDMGQSTATSGARRIRWTTADGTVFEIRPYNNLFQIVRTPSGGSPANALGISSDGSISLDNRGGWRMAMGIQSGAFTVESTSGGTYTDTNVTFPAAFASVPTVVVGFRTGSQAAEFGRCSCAVVSGSITTTGCTIRFYNGDTSPRIPEITWVAIGG